MNSIGVIYNWYAILPQFEAVFTREKIDTQRAVKILKEVGLMGGKSAETKEAINVFANTEENFSQILVDVFKNHKFFSNLLWLNKNMSKIRLKVRRSFLNKVNVSEIISEIEKICDSNTTALMVFNKYFSDLKSWDKKDLSILENEMDECYFRILDRSAGFANKKLRDYVTILKKRAVEDRNFRSSLRDQETDEDTINEDEYFKTSFENECRFVNQAVFSADSDLINLQCLVCFKYFFYNLRVQAAVKDNKKNDMLINYNIN